MKKLFKVVDVTMMITMHILMGPLVAFVCLFDGVKNFKQNYKDMTRWNDPHI